MDLEYTNLVEALRLALSQHVSPFNLNYPLSLYLDRSQDQARGLELGETTLRGLDAYPKEALTGILGAEFIGAVDDIAKRYFLLHRYDEAEAAYRRALALNDALRGIPAEFIGSGKAGILNQLGAVARAQRRWAQAEEFYQKALALKVELNDRHSQASTYHNLGTVAREQRRWAQAEEFYQKALALYVEFNDRYSQAVTYHQLGRVAQEQRRFTEAADLYLKALTLFAEFQDEHNGAIVLRSLARLRQASGDESLAGRVVDALGVSAQEAAKRLDQAAGTEDAEDTGEGTP